MKLGFISFYFGRKKLTNQVSEIIQRLKEEYPDVRCELDYQTPLQLLVATVLSAQTTDKQVNKVTAKMFADCPDLDAFLKLILSMLTKKI